MMRFIIYAFFLLLSIGLLSSCRSAKPAKCLMLTADSIKYWNLTDGKFGIAFKKNHSFVEYDGKGMYTLIVFLTNILTSTMIQSDISMAGVRA